MPELLNGHVDLRKKEALLAEPLAQGYRPTMPGWAFWSTDGIPQIYLIRDIELMLTHPIVRSILDYFKGGIAGAEFDIECNTPSVQPFLEKQIERWWDKGVPLLQGGYDYGWIGLEACYTDEPGVLAWDYLLQFSPRDTFVLTRNRCPVGVRVKNVDQKGDVDLWMASADMPAKGIWYPHNPRFGWLYGQSQLLGAWRPWRRLAWRDGAEQVTDMGVYRCAFTGPIVRYPEEDLQAPPGVPATTLDSQGRPRKYARDYARQMAEQAKAGAGIGMPSTMYPPELGGGEKWALEWPSHVLNVDPLISYCKYLQDQISYGIGVPPELIQSGEVGSGYSGRAIPMEAFLSIQQKIADAILDLFVCQILKPLVRLNWGAHVKFEATVKPLLETKRKQQAGGETGGEMFQGANAGRPQKGAANKPVGGPANVQRPPNASRGGTAAAGWSSLGARNTGKKMSVNDPERVKKLARKILKAS